MRGLAALVLTASVATLLPAAASAVPVQGALRLPPSLGDAPSVPRQYWEVRNGIVPTRPDHLDPRRELTVVLRGEAAAEDPGCSYAIVGGDLMPRTLVVEAGSTLRIANRDATEHELHVDAIERFTALSTAPGMARSETIPAGGPYELADALYAHVRGKIVAVSGLVACGELDPRGGYRFADVAPGSYHLEVYRDGAVVAQQDVEVADGGPVTLPELPLGGGEGGGAPDGESEPSAGE